MDGECPASTRVRGSLFTCKVISERGKSSIDRQFNKDSRMCPYRSGGNITLPHAQEAQGADGRKDAIVGCTLRPPALHHHHRNKPPGPAHLVLKSMASPSR